jgi:hypothetical protein
MTPLASQARLEHLHRRVERIVMTTPAVDIHTHLYDPAFKRLLLRGIDELLSYHYLVAEAFRYLDLPADKFWAMSKAERAELIWDVLFLKRSPLSEAGRGILTTLNLLGFDVWRRDLNAIRRWYARQNPETQLDRVLEVARVQTVYMTNSPFDELERPVWEKGFPRDERFVAGLRLDPLLLNWRQTVPKLTDWGYRVTPDLSRRSVDQVIRFLADWTTRMDARYLMVSLPPEFQFPAGDECAQLLEKAVLPFCRDQGRPLALMMGVKRAVNPELSLAGDGVGRSDLSALQNLCAGFPQNKFLATVLSWENQHELCVLARKFRNLHLFGCWWFLNVPGAVETITRLRLELVGLSMTPQHSDARVLDQLVYKWHHFRQALVRVLSERYARLIDSGWEPGMQEIERDVQELLGGAFLKFCG